MDAVRVGGALRWFAVTVTVTGAVLLMAGVLAGASAAADVRLPLPPHWPAAARLAWGLSCAGLACGVLLVMMLAGGGGRRRGQLGQAMAGSPDEWLDAMRPEGLLLGQASARGRAGR